MQQLENKEYPMDEQEETKSALLIMADRFYIPRFVQQSDSDRDDSHLTRDKFLPFLRVVSQPPRPERDKGS